MKDRQKFLFFVKFYNQASFPVVSGKEKRFYVSENNLFSKIFVIPVDVARTKAAETSPAPIFSPSLSAHCSPHVGDAAASPVFEVECQSM